MNTPTMSRWYVALQQKKEGPFSLEQLRQLLLKGELRPGDMLLPVGEPKWVAASSVPGLFETGTLVLPTPAPSDTASPAKVLLSEETLDDSRRTAPSQGPASDFPPLPGYELLAELGRGGMGVVYKARDRQLRHLVAIKMPLPHCVERDEDRERFLREARAAAGLRHPNICPIHRVDEFEGRPFIVLAFIEGEDVRSWMNRENRTARACAELVARLARAVAHAHQHGVIHRDIKPANTMIEASTNEPILMDFGLAKELDKQDVQLSQSGQIIGTPAYMAPEQASGHVHQVGPAADVYSLGALLYHLLCKRPPFEGNLGEILRKVLTEEPPSPRTLVPSVHRDLETVCLKAIQKEPSSRYVSALALAEDLERFAAGEAILARREGTFARVRRWVRRNSVAACSLSALLVAIVAAFFIVSHIGRDSRLKQREGALRDEFASATWSSETLKDLERRIDEYDQDVPGRGPVLRQEAYQALFDSAIARMRKPRLDAEDHATLDAMIQLLQARDSALAGELKSRRESRNERLDLVFDVSAPFEQSETVFGKNVVVSRDKTHLNNGKETLLSEVASTGAMQIEATFGTNWEKTTRLGLLLNAIQKRDIVAGYSFELITPSRKPPEAKTAKRLTFAEARASHDEVILSIRRNNVVLRERTLHAEDLEPGKLRLEAKRDRERLTFQVNALPPLEFHDLFAASHEGVCGLSWPPQILLESFKGYRRTLASEASPLEKGDDLYQNGMVAEALAYYREQARLSAGTPVGQEARVKEGIALAGLKRDDEAASLLEGVLNESGKVWPHVAATNLWVVRLRQRKFDEADLILDTLLLRKQQGAFGELALRLPASTRARYGASMPSAGKALRCWPKNPTVSATSSAPCR